MTWQLASFAVLAFALATGFWWYERARPPAKVLALVATLAALAAIGRIAFAPLPNVKPTTDIVLIAGYVLGGAPGFVVGALTALVSNLFFGQGPYTPWQMVSWGLVGVCGALLARLFGRDLGRVPLAAACGAAGLGYGLIMDVHMWVMYSGHTLAELWVVLGRGLPFNIAHAVGNVVFCFAFGPVLVRTLLRFRERLEVRWRPLPAAPRATAPLAVALAALAVGAAGLAAPPAADASAAQVRYLRGVQNADGGFGASPGQSSSPMYTGWVVLGLAAAGTAPDDVRRNGRSPADYLVATIGRVRETADVERTILALVAAGRSPRSVRGRDLVAELVRKRRADGSFTGLVNQTAFAILALRAAGRPATDATVRSAGRWLARQQNADGGFNFATKGGQSGIDDTAGALQALVAAGRGTGPAVAKAAAFIARRQNPDGGFPLNPGGASNAQSAAWAIQALVAAGRDPDRQRRGGARPPRAYLRSLAAGSGAVRYSRTSTQTPVWVTAQALTGLAAAPLPIRPRPVARRAAAAAPASTPAPAPAAAPEPARSAPARQRATRARDVANDGTAFVARLAPAARAAGVLVAVLVPASDRPA